MRRSTTACGLLLALAATCAFTFTTAASGASGSAHRLKAEKQALAFYTGEIRKLRTETWYWQRVMGVPQSRPNVRRLETASVPRLQQLDGLWTALEHRAYQRAQHPPNLDAWLCIHRYEGSWTDAGGPYYGGLQMDMSFQSSYGGWLLARKGTADHWTPLEQIWTAVKAARVRGFWPWPNTARFCGLI